MTKTRNDDRLDDSAYELLVAEEELILHAQMLIQHVLNGRGISQRELAEKLDVSQSYVSQMLGTSARNLTLRTIARVMKALDVKATLVLDNHVDTVETNAEATRTATLPSPQPWGEIITLPTRKKTNRRHDTDARAFASYDPPVREIELALVA